MTVHRSLSPFALAGACLLLLALGGCKGKNEAKRTADLDSNLAAAAAQNDPALSGALQDQIRVDPSLAGQRGAKLAVDTRALLHVPPPTTTEAAARKGITLGELAKSQAAPAQRSTKNCDKIFHYSMRWAKRLPDATPLYPDARVSEAAGNDSPPCRVRIVSFASNAPLATILDWYYTKAIRAGYTAEHQVSGTDHILGGTRESDGGAYYLIASARRGGGTEVDIVANHGR